MTKKQRGLISAAGTLLVMMGGAYLAGFYWGFGDEPNVEYGIDGGLMGVGLVAVLIAGYGLLGGVIVAVIAWVESGK